MLLERPDTEGAELLLSGGAAACHSLSLHAKLPPRSQDGRSDQAMNDKHITRYNEWWPWDEGIVPSVLTRNLSCRPPEESLPSALPRISTALSVCFTNVLYPRHTPRPQV
jgi:hypothetical protein